MDVVFHTEKKVKRRFVDVLETAACASFINSWFRRQRRFGHFTITQLVTWRGAGV